MDDRVIRVERTLRVIGGRWKPAIMFSLIMGGTKRFSQLQREIPGVTQRMLTKQLRDLVDHGLVERVFHEQVPPRVEYSATALGRTLHPIYKAVCDWSTAHDADVATVSDRRQQESAPVASAKRSAAVRRPARRAATAPRRAD